MNATYVQRPVGVIVLGQGQVRGQGSQFLTSFKL